MSALAKPTQPAPRVARLGISFDQWVVAVILVLVGAVAIGVLRGDRVGVRLTRFGPVGDARTTSPVTIQFSEDMDRANVAAHFRIEPPVPGEISWSGRSMAFHPSTPLDAGGRYTVTLGSGASSDGGRQLIEEQRFSFMVQGPRIAYLAPVDTATKNVWVVDPSDPSTARQLTQSRAGVLAYDVSPDGGSIVYAEPNDAKGSDLKLVDLDTREVRQLTTCGNGICTDPVWSPDGSKIAFSRQASAVSPIPGVPRDDTRVWLVDPATKPAKAWPLFSDPQVRAHYNPRFSPDSSWIAVSQPTGVSNGSAGVLLFNFNTNVTKFFATTGPAGAFSVDSASFSFPALANVDGEVRTVLQRADMTTLQAEVVSPSDTRMNPTQLDWTTSGRRFTLAQRSPAEEIGLGQQLYSLDDGGLSSLLVEPNYDHQAFAWDASGQKLVMERSLVRATDPSQDVRSAIWLYDPASGDLTRLASSAFRPKWIP